MTLLPYPPNWSTPFRVTREFSTKIITSRSGKEQRRANRNTPRKKVEFDILLEGSDALAFRRRVQKYAGLDLTVADESRPTALADVLAVGDDTLVFEVVPEWMPGPVILRSGTQVAQYSVATTGADTATLSADSTLDWPAGTTVLPALTGRLDPSIELTHATDTVVAATVTLRVTPLSEPTPVPTVPDVTFNGREVFLKKPNWSAPPTAVFANPYETTDYGYGAIAHFNPVDFVSRTHKATYLALSAAEAVEIENVFIRANGQRGEFYVPSWLNDLPPASGAAIGATQFTVAGTDAANLLNGDTTLHAICIRYRDGAFGFYTVTSITVSSGNSDVHLGSALTRAIDNTVAGISWMPVHRFASDLLTTEWLTNGVAQMQISLMSLEDLP